MVRVRLALPAGTPGGMVRVVRLGLGRIRVSIQYVYMLDKQNKHSQLSEQKRVLSITCWVRLQLGLGYPVGPSESPRREYGKRALSIEC